MTQKNVSLVMAIVLSITVTCFLFVIKLAAALITNSMGILASAVDSLMDIAVSIANLIAAITASRPPDKNHAYGHGKIESLAAMFQSIFISCSGIYLVVESVRRFIFGNKIQHIPLGIAVILLSFVIGSAIVWILKRKVRNKRSLILESETLHYTSDLMAYGGVVIGLILSAITPYVFWDLLVSLVIALYIFKAAYVILKRSIEELLDVSLPPDQVRNIIEGIYGYDSSIVGVHNFRSRRVGEKIFMDFHIEIRGEKDFKRAHSRTEDLIRFLKQKYSADITVHFDPEGED